MSEPPLQVDADGALPTPRKVGHRVLDMVIAGVAIVISLISLAVAIENGRTQERLLGASTWPMVQFYTSNKIDGDEAIAMVLRNSGVGPARVESVTMTWRGRTMRSNAEFLQACCGAVIDGPRYGHGLQTSTVSPNVLLAGQSQPFLYLPSRPETAAVFEKLQTERDAVKMSICYCSVLDECWLTDGYDLHPPRVKSCPVGAEFPGPASAG